MKNDECGRDDNRRNWKEEITLVPIANPIIPKEVFDREMLLNKYNLHWHGHAKLNVGHFSV